MIGTIHQKVVYDAQPSPIQTLTVGSGFTPDQPLVPMARGLYRRYGISPVPEGWFSCSFIIPRSYNNSSHTEQIYI